MFDGLSRNFSSKIFLSVHDVKVGMVLSRIEVNGYWWENCVIKNVYESEARGGLKSVRFNFSRTNANVDEDNKTKQVIVMESGEIFAKVDFIL
jgi:hypothetical protein